MGLCISEAAGVGDPEADLSISLDTGSDASGGARVRHRDRGYSTIQTYDPTKVIETYNNPQRYSIKLPSLAAGRRSSCETPTVYTHHQDAIVSAWVTQRGYYPENLNKANQDAYSYHIEFGNNPDTEQASFFAVYDGHGKCGDLVSEYTRDNLPARIVEAIDEKKKSKQSMLGGLVKVAKRLSGSFINVTKKMSGNGSQSKIERRGSRESFGDTRGSRDSKTGMSSSSGVNIILEDDDEEETVSKGSPSSDDDNLLSSEDIKEALRKAHTKVNDDLKKSFKSDNGVNEADLSGTTSISLYLHNNTMYISNIGDSRAILISKKEGGNESDVVVQALSKDQTPYRKDERVRIKHAGGRIMSMDQMDGLAPMHDNWSDITLGESIDEQGDPPRVWHPTLSYPGCAFTRSIGDFVAKSLGVTAEPEILVQEIKENDRYIVLASDGVFEFLTNKAVMEMVLEDNDPLMAANSIVSRSYELWLNNEVRTDDITIIILKVNCTRALEGDTNRSVIDDDSDGVEDETISIKKTRTASKDGDSIQFISSDQRHHRGSFSS
jgi:serine/threonine protein phosphatase PrpC